MENSVLRSTRVHLVRHEIRPVVLKKRSPRYQSPRGLVVFNQQRNQYGCKAIANSLLLRSITRRHCNRKQWLSNTVKDTFFSTKPILRKQPRSIRMGLGSDTGNDHEDALSSKNGRNSTWSLFDNLRCVVFLHIGDLRSFFCTHFEELKPYYFFDLSNQQGIQGR